MTRSLSSSPHNISSGWVFYLWMLCWLGCQGMWTKGRCAPQTTAEDWSSLPKRRTQLVGNNRCPIRKPQSENKPKGLEASCLQSPGAADMEVPGWVEEVVPRVTVLPSWDRGEAVWGCVRQKRQERQLPLTLYIKNIMVLVHKIPLFTSKHHPCLPSEP